MKRIGKICAVVIAVMVMLFGFGVTAYAAEKTQDGLVATITSDKENYSAGEEIKINMTVKNTNDFDVESVSLEALLPDGIVLKDTQESTVTADVLKSGESLSLDLIAVEKSTKALTNPTEDAKAPTEPTRVTNSNASSVTSDNNINTSGKAVVNTGSSTWIIVIFAIFVISIVVFVIAYKYRKKAIQGISILLCICMVCSAFGVAMIPVRAKDTGTVPETNKEFYVKHDLIYKNSNISINMHIKYTMSSSEEIISDRMMLYSDTYGVVINTNKNAKFELCVDDENLSTDIVPLYENDRNICNLTYDEDQERFIGNLDLKSDIKCTKSYYCILNGEKSNTVTVNFGELPNKEDLEREKVVENEIASITSKYQNDNLNEEIIEEEINEVEDALRMYITDGIVTEYNIYKDNVYVEFNSGVRWIFCLIPNRANLNYDESNDLFAKSKPLISSSLSLRNEQNNKKNEIITLQPFSDFLQSTDFDDVSEHIADLNIGYTFSRNLDNESVTISELKNLNKYKIIMIDTHGYYNENPFVDACIETGESVSIEKTEEYWNDILSGSIVKMGSDSDMKYGVNYKFFNTYYSGKNFNDSLVYIGACYCGKSKLLAQSLIDKGVGAVLAYNNLVYSVYSNNMFTEVFSNLQNIEDKQYLGIIESVSRAKEKIGYFDDSRAHWYNIIFGDYSDVSNRAELCLFQPKGKNWRLIADVNENNSELSGTSSSNLQNGGVLTGQGDNVYWHKRKQYLQQKNK